MWPLFAPTIEVWIAEWDIFHAARARKSNSHTDTHTHTGLAHSGSAGGQIHPAEVVTPPPYVTHTPPLAPPPNPQSPLVNPPVPRSPASSLKTKAIPHSPPPNPPLMQWHHLCATWSCAAARPLCASGPETRDARRPRHRHRKQESPDDSGGRLLTEPDSLLKCSKRPLADYKEG